MISLFSPFITKTVAEFPYLDIGFFFNIYEVVGLSVLTTFFWDEVERFIEEFTEFGYVNDVFFKN